MVPKKGQPGREPIKDVKQIVRMQLDLQYLDIFRLSPSHSTLKMEKIPFLPKASELFNILNITLKMYFTTKIFRPLTKSVDIWDTDQVWYPLQHR